MSEMITLNFQVERSLKKRLDIWPWGIKSAVLRKLLEDACDIYDKEGSQGLGKVVDGKLHLVPKADQLVEG